MELVELFKKKIEDISDQQINETIPKCALKMNDEQIATVSFVFWLVYMAETDLYYVLNESLKTETSTLSPEVKKKVEEILKEKIKGEKEVNFNDLENFSDKVKAYEALFGETKRTKLLWKLKNIRDDLSHNRIENLKYEGQALSLRKTKEKILIDYFETAQEADFSKSEFLTEDERRSAEILFEKEKMK